MNFAIIGAGSVGRALAGSLTRAGHEVVISAADPAHALEAAEASGVRAAPDNAAAVQDADVVILAIPFAAAAETAATEIAPYIAGKIVIDATNPTAPDGGGLATEGSSAAEYFAERLPGARMVKAFNSMFASRMASPDAEVDAFVAGDDEIAKREVLSLVETLGFRPLDVGPLRFARYLEGMAYVNISLNAANGWDWTSAWTLQR